MIPPLGSVRFENVRFPLVIGDTHLSFVSVGAAVAVDVFRPLPQDPLQLLHRDRLFAGPLRTSSASGDASEAMAFRLEPSLLRGFIVQDGDVVIRLDTTRIEVVQGSQVLLQVSQSSISGFEVGVRIDGQNIALGARLVEGTRTLWRSSTIALTTLVGPHGMLDSTTFEDCRIEGPAVLAAIDAASQMLDSTFIPGGPQGPVVLHGLANPLVPPGVIPVRSTIFNRCQMYGISVLGPPAPS